MTFDDDVAAQLERFRAHSGKRFKEIVNQALRVGLARLEHEDHSAQGPFTRPVSLGRPRLPDIDDVSEALALIEGDGYR